MQILNCTSTWLQNLNIITNIIIIDIVLYIISIRDIVPCRRRRKVAAVSTNPLPTLNATVWMNNSVWE